MHHREIIKNETYKQSASEGKKHIFL